MSIPKGNDEIQKRFVKYTYNNLVKMSIRDLRYLVKKNKKIDEFFNTLSGKKYVSETAEVKEKLDKTLTRNITSSVNVLKRDGKAVEITTPAEIKNILGDIDAQTKAIFGEKPIKAEV